MKVSSDQCRYIENMLCIIRLYICFIRLFHDIVIYSLFYVDKIVVIKSRRSNIRSI